MAGRIPKVVVIGQALVEMTLKCDAVPQPGGTVESSLISCIPVGSGFNQAIGAALCGCNVQVLAKIGNDCFGELIRANFQAYGVDTSILRQAEAMFTGTSIAMVNRTGANACCLAEGANKALTPEDINTASVEAAIQYADLCLIHGKIPREVVIAAIRCAVMHRTKVILDPACSLADPHLPVEYYWADILVPNNEEAAGLAEGNGRVHETKLIASDLVARGVKCAIITMGSRGCVLANRETAEHIPAFQIDMVDQTCAGDAFAAALAASVAAGDNIRNAVRFASAAGALACTKFGCQDALPGKDEIIQLLQRSD